MVYCVDKLSFERMQDIESKGIDEFKDYEEFINWNEKCLEEMSYEDQIWVWGLCKRLMDSMVNIMDMEDCGIWTADQFYFLKNKKICIVHPR